MEILKVENLCKTYGKGETLVEALNKYIILNIYDILVTLTMTILSLL